MAENMTQLAKSQLLIRPELKSGSITCGAA